MTDEKREPWTPAGLREEADFQDANYASDYAGVFREIAQDWEASLKAAVEAEREACARACYKQGVADEGGWADDVNQTVEACAKAIRARGEK